MNKGIGLVAYGDSDSESSDEDIHMTPSVSINAKAQAGKRPKSDLSFCISRTQQYFDERQIDLGPFCTSIGSSADTLMNQKASASIDRDTGGRPIPQDTISARSIINATPTASESLNKIASTNLLRQGLVASDENLQPKSAFEHGHSFTRSQSGTPLPADHSAAAEVFNTPTEGRSPRPSQIDRVLIAEEAKENEDDKDRSLGDLSSQNRSALMRLLLQPKPIPGVENFGIPPSPEGEINPDVQAKMEQFHHVKVTRGIHFNQSLMRNKNFRNPHIYASLVGMVALNETGSNFEKTEFFDFEGYGPESYATGIVEAQKQANERLVQQQAMGRSHLQFVPGSTSLPGVPIVSGSFGVGAAPKQQQMSSTTLPPTGTTTAIASGRARKSKWDVPQDDSNSKRPRH
ncbi:hypothetical protein BG011_008429 [Mortierella polycephala]|uniref:HCNGP-domain-containing protein n=1 Tax=Mortierella polycephala TaxID=41804 RepID=A0A9P6QJQ9_9FUNG|nr:hypothetical protein BG011_008429 [Mortierella polycephala]